MLAFALESKGDLEGERRVRSALAAEFPDDPRIQTDYGRVLERSGEEPGALRAYRRARALSAGRPAPDLDAAIERMKGRTAPEVGAPLTVIRGGRTTGAEGHLYSHWLSRRLLLQAGARRRRLSILAEGSPSTRRPAAWQSLWLVGADAVLWRPGAAIRGEMLDEAMVAPTTLASAMTLAYRHYGLSTQTTPDFDALIGLAPRGSVNEGSVATTLASPQGRLGLELRAGLAHDSARRARAWRAGGALIWAPTPATRWSLGYEGATEVISGLIGRRRTGWFSVHVDL